ncbi:MAG TPA: sulfite reductase subunit alpha [Tepidisphaeraceae bacterium]|jgi:sulfite reductase (NADPH) flavoprotein alpha-component|nr:sulfite reductase subunit alpha [Tepidisphaeraceae bacterium]
MNTAVLSTVPVIPDSAPFTTAQRAWLNGFFAGLFGGQVACGGSAAVAAPAVTEAVVTEEDEAMPWHDSALSMEERLKLAEGKPKERVLMAAMAQLDCGACGYLCQTYAEALVRGEEKDMTRCAPGGKDTAKKLKALMADQGSDKIIAPSQVGIKRAVPVKEKDVYDRNNPFAARLLANKPLNKAGSAKDTRFIAFDLKGSGLSYRVGDALGVYPENCPESVNWLLDRLNVSGAEEVSGLDGLPTTLFEALQKHYQITTPSEPMIDLLARSCDGPAHAEALQAMLEESGPGIPEGHEIIDLLTMFPTARPSFGDFVAALRPLQPRLYSISSSLKAHPDEVHLTVGVVRYVNARQRQCKGVASTFMADRLRTGQKARVFVQPSHGFRLPFDQSTPIIMVGPGTGIAPFRAFLEERKADNAAGKNWLFFGDQRGEFDFLYQQELEGYLQDGTLKYLDTAFSRDQSEKIYIQHRMLQRRGEIWSWIERGAHFYVCGDAKRMAADVDTALRQVVAQEGGMSEENAKAFLAEMTKSKRYQRDVY